ncbi:MAG TPA: hypothetical protein V6D17_09150 [Candidatus Obscuribacterales bacterium]
MTLARHLIIIILAAWLVVPQWSLAASQSRAKETSHDGAKATPKGTTNNSQTGAKRDWFLRQASQVHGPIDCFVGPKGVRLEARDISILALSPDYKVTFVNNANRCYMEQTPQTAQKKTYWGANPKKGDKISFQRGKTTKIAGLMAVEYTRVVTNGRSRAVTGTCWVTKDLSLPRASSAALSKLLNVPPELGIPLRLIGLNAAKMKILYLDTIDAQRCVLPANTFNRPKGFRKVFDEVALILEDESSQKSGSVTTELLRPPTR